MTIKKTARRGTTPPAAGCVKVVIILIRHIQRKASIQYNFLWGNKVNIMSDSNIFSIQEKIGLLEKKVADLEYEIELAEKAGRSEAYIIATKYDLVATKNEHVELMKKENFLLESQKVSGIMSFLIQKLYLKSPVNLWTISSLFLKTISY